jgi:hypothetical protein
MNNASKGRNYSERAFIVSTSYLATKVHGFERLTKLYDNFTTNFREKILYHSAPPALKLCASCPASLVGCWQRLF